MKLGICDAMDDLWTPELESHTNQLASKEARKMMSTLWN